MSGFSFVCPAIAAAHRSQHRSCHPRQFSPKVVEEFQVKQQAV
ncbi:hypothetical protein OF001_U60032 [Pseudomonas sp. OF001]|nr:hypothetical protein OF001_U60032 [Pseudomonas sp. OF001]